MSDAAITGWLGFITFLLVLLGTLMALFPPLTALERFAYLAGVVILGLISVFLMREQSRRGQAQQDHLNLALDGIKASFERPADLAPSPSQTARDYWLDMAQRFERIPASVIAEWSEVPPERLSWNLSGERVDVEECSSLCMLAGEMLMTSPRVRRSLPEWLRARPDPIDRWLDFLWERHKQRARPGVPLPLWIATEKLPDGTEQMTGFGEVEKVGQEAKRACIECSALEI